MNIDAFLASVSLVTIAEIGDKTQLLSIILAARYRKPMVIVAGIFAATTLNHLLAAWVGHTLGSKLDANIMGWVVCILFIGLGLWALVPDKMEEKKDNHKFGAFTATVIAFFIAEMGDKTQIATVTLAAQYNNMVQVVLGTTLGMMLANVPAVLLGEKILAKIPLFYMRVAAAMLFLFFGLIELEKLLR